MPRKQINVSVYPEEYDALKEQADALGMPVARYCRDLILDTLLLVDDVVDDDSAFRVWVLATLALLHLSKGERPG